MEQCQTHPAQQAGAADPNRMRLLETAQARVLKGDKEFTIADLCGEAGVERTVFHDHFAGKTALMAALMRNYPVNGPVSAPSAAPPNPVSKADTTSEPSVHTPDEWFERRLRVFERALTALEVKAEATACEQARVIAELEARLNGRPSSEAARAPAQPDAQIVPETVTASETAQVYSLEPLPETHDAAQIEPLVAEVVPPVENPPPAEDATELVQDIVQDVAQPSLSVCEPIPAPVDLRQGLREKGHPVPDLETTEAPKPAKANPRMRLMAIAACLLVAAFVSVGFMVGRNVLDADARERTPDAVAHRQVAHTPLHKTMALADAGDARAQARLALAYLRGQGSAADADAALLWCMSAARAGNPVAQYLLGALYQQGDRVKADPVEAATWFSRAAEKGNLKAMHNLAIAYAQGLGLNKDEAKAAEWFTRAAERGYVDSAFDLAVLYERGEGVPQDLKQALKWYGIAALAGDQPSKERADFLRGQMKGLEIKLATNAAMAFSPLPALEDANSL